ncbi:ATP6D [Mytilus edulis]|uniref:ATPeV0D n=1 Tax=Mytilus edulis TaxID=6550 RepID=A0A8S3S0H0_MYTED|nr:ATP6D [Mytilus edulis]
MSCSENDSTNSGSSPSREADFDEYGQFGYALEPEYTEEELHEMEAAESSRNQDILSNPRQFNTDWCSCTKCIVMPLLTECLCCHEFTLFDDLKLHLQGTDYGNFLANEPSPLTVSVIDDKLKEKMVVEFQHLRNHCLEPLATFLDYITYSYMIDNIILLITGTLHQRPLSELIPKCHPLGSFEQMEAIHIASTPAELYNAVLVDTPLAPYFIDCILEQDLDEMNTEIIRNTLYKAYLEDFYAFCQETGGATADVMCEALSFEADRRAFIITINSFGTELTKDDRSKLYPHCGKLYPAGLARLALADDYDQVRAVADCFTVS